MTDAEPAPQEASSKNSPSSDALLQSSPQSEEHDGSNLIINYLPDQMTEMIMFDIFSKYGEVDSVRVIRDLQTQQPRGYGFVKYKSADSARAAIENLDGLNIMDKKLKVALSRPGGARVRSNLFVGSLPPSFTEEDMTRLFSDFHPIIDIRILRFPDGTPKQCGFVRLDNDLTAQRAIEAINGTCIDGHRIQVKLANGSKKKREERGHSTLDSDRGLYDSNPYNAYNMTPVMNALPGSPQLIHMMNQGPMYTPVILANEKRGLYQYQNGSPPQSPQLQGMQSPQMQMSRRSPPMSIQTPIVIPQGSTIMYDNNSPVIMGQSSPVLMTTMNASPSLQGQVVYAPMMSTPTLGSPIPEFSLASATPPESSTNASNQER